MHVVFLLASLVPLSLVAAPPASLPVQEVAPLDASPGAPRPQLSPYLPPRYELRATLSEDGARIDGALTITLNNHSGAALDTIALWLYPNRFATRPDFLTDLNQVDYYRGPYQPAEMTLSSVSVDGAPRPWSCSAAEEGRDTLCQVEAAVSAGAEVRVELSYTATVPERYGRYGRGAGAVMLDGGFYPALAYLGPGGFTDQRPPGPGEFSLTLSAPGQEGCSFINGQGPFAPSEARSVSLGEVPYAAWFVLPHCRLREEILSNGATARYYYTDSLFLDRVADVGDPWRAGPPGLDTDVTRDYPGEVLSTVAEGVSFLDSLDLGPWEARDLVLLELPLRGKLSASSPGALLISDRAFKVYPRPNLVKFHRLHLLRSLYAALVEARVTSYEREEDLPWVADALGAYLSDLFHFDRYLKQSFAKEMLEPYAFISEMDKLRWLPEVPFRDAYFKSPYERDLFRDDVRRFPRRWPVGKFLYQKLRDLLGPDSFQGFARDYLRGRTSWRVASEAHYGTSLGWFYAQWMRPHPILNYRLVSHSSTPTTGGRYTHRVEVEKQGDTWVREPISVLVVEANGARQLLAWPMDEVSHTFTWDSGSLLVEVRVDPFEHAHEEDPGNPEDPKGDNRYPGEWRRVLDGFYLDAGSGGVAFTSSASARRARDKRHFFFVGTALSSGQRAPGGLRINDFEQLYGGYRRGFGPSLNAERRRGALTASFAGERFGPRVLNDGASFTAGAQARGTVSLRYSDRASNLFSWGSTTAEASLSYAFGVPLAGPSGAVSPCDGGALCQSVNTAASVARLWSLDGGRVLGVRLHAAGIWGAPFAQDLLELGGADVLKGYPIDTVEGRARLLGGVEYRTPLLRGLDVNLFELDRWTGLDTAVWLTGASVSSADAITTGARPLLTEESFFAEVGVGLRFWGTMAGVDPAMFALNLAAPLVGSALAGGPFAPVQLLIGFEHNF